MKRAEKRQHLVTVATELFNRHGYRAVGIDQVIAESGVAKTTLYRHFASKEALIVAVLAGIDERFRAEMRAYVDARSQNAREQLLLTFDFLHAWFTDAAFHGCPFVNAAGEYGERDHPVFHAALAHKRAMVAYFRLLAGEAGLNAPDDVAEAVNLLHEGAIAVAHISGDARAAIQAREAAGVLLSAAG